MKETEINRKEKVETGRLAMITCHEEEEEEEMTCFHSQVVNSLLEYLWKLRMVLMEAGMNQASRLEIPYQN